MKQLNFSKKNQGGFAFLAIIILVIVLIVGVTVALMSSGGMDSGQNSVQTNKTYGSGVMQAASNLKSAISMKAVEGVDPATITLDTTAGTGLYLTSEKPQVPTTWLATGVTSAVWQITNNAVPSVGDTGNDYQLYVKGLSTGVCEQINKGVYGATTIPTLSNNLAAFEAGGATLAAATGSITGWTMGCVVPSGYTTGAVFYAVFKQQ